jgi:outer membrane protein TolC
MVFFSGAFMKAVWGLVLCVCLGGELWALSLEEALLRADRAPDVRAFAADVEISEARLVSAGRLPDPRLALTLEDFMLEGETRYRPGNAKRMIGLMQEIPAASRRAAERQKARAAVEEKRRGGAFASLAARREAALAWLRLHFLEQKAELLRARGREIRLRQDATAAALAGGRATADAALEVLIMARALEDENDLLARDLQLARVNLSRWIGPLADSETATGNLPAWLHEEGENTMPDGGVDDAEHTAALRESQARIDLAQAELAMARAGRDSNWSLELGVGQDAMGKHMLMARIGFSLPLFPATRQDPEIAAAWSALRKTEAEHAMRRAEFERQRAELRAEAQALKTQQERLEKETLPLLERAIALAEAAFAGGKGQAERLIMARETLLAARMRRIDLEAERMRVRAQLHFLQQAPSADQSLSPIDEIP